MDLKKKKVLYIDDNPEISEVVVELIKTIGFDCTHFSSPIKAMSYLNSSVDTDLVITEFLLPEMDGADFYKNLSRGTSPNFHFVIFTSVPIRASNKMQNENITIVDKMELEKLCDLVIKRLEVIEYF